MAFFAWRLLEQQRMVEAQSSRERLEQAADRITAIVRGTIAESSDRLGAGLVSLGDLLFTLSPTSLDATPPGRLLSYPFPPPDPEPHPDVFAEAELFEFPESQPEEALRAFERFANSTDISLRAGALLRIARVLRKLGRREESITAYRKLAAIDANIAGVPAALVARHAVCELSQSPREAMELRNDLSSGRWRLTRGQFEFYWSEAGRMAGTAEPPPEEKRRLTEIAQFVWNDRVNHPDARGHEIAWIGGAPILLIWRGTPEQRRVLVTHPESLLQRGPADAGIHFAFVDAEGHTLAGTKDGSARSVVRTAAESELPWTLFVSETKPKESELLAQQRFLLLGLSVMMLFLVLGTYFIARAIRREAEVQRMQSHFVSTVSHEFRSPLTSMRQLSEMLALGRVPGEERRLVYYETLVRETTRLQRLIEGLLNFGRMEAGARQYQFEELDASAIVESVVSEFEPQIASTGKHIETVRTDAPCWIEADAEAISVALRNLLDNAVKYSPDQPTVWVGCEMEREKVAIRVRDRGLGIAEAERRTIFRKFMRGSAAAAANVKGSGVGLAMVSHIVAAHGGEMVVASELGRGSTFTMLFPARSGNGMEKACQKS
ncbi:MAG TPA: ATP-binding protein [Bryobacteraceae bacterium]|nr:ATP-binding protein [Bryobacteraceae bacterium]